jgi:hypothetical protein
MIFDQGTVEKSLKKKGFKKGNKGVKGRKRKQKHIKYFFHYKEKKTPVFTFVSHSDQDIDDYLISKMSKQMKLHKKDFIAFVNCPLTKDKYIKKLQKTGIIK